MAKLLKVDRSASVVCTPTTMVEQGLGEATDLETWIVEHPEVIDPSMKVVTTQFNRWASADFSALERPDIIGLTDSGELVVLELKRVGDKNVHLQALTYAALASSFTLDLLAQEHASWYNKKFNPVEKMTDAQAKEELENFIESEDEIDEELVFALPRVVLVSPEFPPQVVTTVQWLSEVAPDLSIECHQYQLFNVADGDGESGVVVSFNQMFPVKDPEESRLRAQSPRVVVAREQQQRARQRNAVPRILEDGLIADGSALEFNPNGLAAQESVPAINEWLDAEPSRRDFTWDAHSKKPLRWGAEPDKRWSPTGLSKELFKQSGIPGGTFSGTLAFFYQGKNLWVVGNRAPSDS